MSLSSMTSVEARTEWHLYPVKMATHTLQDMSWPIAVLW